MTDAIQSILIILLAVTSLLQAVTAKRTNDRLSRRIREQQEQITKNQDLEFQNYVLRKEADDRRAEASAKSLRNPLGL